MFPHFERVEQMIRVSEMGPENVNANNRVLMRGADRLGFRGRFLRHNRTDCVGCGYCAIGCAYDRKNDALTTYLAAASRAGARIVPDAQVDKVLHKQGTVTGVSGRFTALQGGKRPRFRVVAPVVVLAAGALESPMLWFRSGLPDSYGIAGRTLHLHPYAVLTGVFDETIAAWQGPPQSYVVDEFLNLDKINRRRFPIDRGVGAADRRRSLVSRYRTGPPAAHGQLRAHGGHRLLRARP